MSENTKTSALPLASRLKWNQSFINFFYHIDSKI